VHTEGVGGRLRGDPDLFVRIAENALTVAESLREDYFKSTLLLARAMRDEFRAGGDSYRLRDIPQDAPEPCAVAFVDGGLSRIDVGLAVPLIVRAGIFRVKQGERDPNLRETFDHFPLMLGQLRGGLKSNSKYGDVVRIIVELGAMVTALEDEERFGDIRLLMLHGPLQFVSGPFFEHWFFHSDYEEMLGKSENRPHIGAVLEGFEAMCDECRLRRTEDCSPETRENGRRPAVCVMAFLQNYILDRARDKDVLVCSAIERSFGRSITKHVVSRLLEDQPELFDRLLAALEIEGRGKTVQADAILDATRYNDPTLLSLSMERGECLEWYPLNPMLRTHDRRAELFPSVQSTFMRTTAARYPMRLEAPASYGPGQLDEILARAFDYASLLPNYAFPIGLDIVDKFAAIPGWMSKAYRQLILAQYGKLLAGEYYEITDLESLKMLTMVSGNGSRSRQTRPGAIE
jgi:hypothetical protein